MASDVKTSLLLWTTQFYMFIPTYTAVGHWCVGGTYCLTFNPEEGRPTPLRDMGEYLPVGVALHLGRLESMWMIDGQDDVYSRTFGHCEMLYFLWFRFFRIDPGGSHVECIFFSFTTHFPKSTMLIISKIISVRKWYREIHVSHLWSPRPRLLYRAETPHPPRLPEPVACSYRADNIACPSRRLVAVCSETLATVTNDTLCWQSIDFLKRWIKWYI